MKKKLLLTISLCLLTILSKADVIGPFTYNGLSVTYTYQSSINRCEPQVFTVNVTNNNNTAVTNIGFILNDPASRISFDFANIASVQDATRISTDVVNKTVIISSIAANGGQMDFELPYNANCSNGNAADPSFLAGISIVSDNPANLAALSQSLSFFISSGVLSFDQSPTLATSSWYNAQTNPVSNWDYAGHRLDTYTRVFRFPNLDTKKATGTIKFQETILTTGNNPNEVVHSIVLKKVNTTNGAFTVLDTINNPVVTNNEINAAFDFLGANAVDTDYALFIEENVTALVCPPDNGKVKLSTVNLSVGCKNNDYCEMKTSSAYEMNLSKANTAPVLSVEYNYPPGSSWSSSSSSWALQNKCLSGNTNRKQVRITNTGNADASNVIVYFRATSETNDKLNLSLVEESSYSIGYYDANGALKTSGMSVSTDNTRSMATLRSNVYYGGEGPGNLLTYSNCFDDSSNIILLRIYNFDKLAQGESVVISYTETSCCIQQGIYNGVDLFMPYVATNFSLDCSSSPGGQSYGSDFAVKNMHFFESMGSFQMFGADISTPLTSTDPSVTNVYNDFTQQYAVQLLDFDATKSGGDFSQPLGDHVQLVFDVIANANTMLAPSSSTAPGNIALFDPFPATGNPNNIIPAVVPYSTVSAIQAIDPSFHAPTTGADNFMGAKASFTIPLTGSTTQEKLKNLSNYIRTLELRFQLSGICNRCTTDQGSGGYLIRAYLNLDEACTDCLLLVGQSSAVRGILVNCPGCQYPGVVTKVCDIKRKTYGLVDSDNNGIPDNLSNTGFVDSQNPGAGVRVKMVTEDDVFITTTSSQLFAGEYKTYGSTDASGVYRPGTLETSDNFSPQFLTNICRYDHFQDFSSAEIIVTNEFPVILYYRRNGVLLFTATFTSNTVNSHTIGTSNGAGGYLVQFPVSFIRGLGLPGIDSSFHIEANDEFSISVHYKVTPFDLVEDNQYYQNVDITTNCFMSGFTGLKDITIDSDTDERSPTGAAGRFTTAQFDQLRPFMNFICEAYGNTFVAADQKKNMFMGDTYPFHAATSCGYIISAGYSINGGPYNDNTRTRVGTMDLFPFEVRNFSKPMTFDFFIPAGFVYEGHTVTSISSYRDQGIAFKQNALRKQFQTTPQFIRAIDIIPYAPNTNHVKGELRRITVNSDNSLHYEHTTGATFEFPTSIPNTEPFNDFNEYTEQVVTVTLIPDCASPDMAADFEVYMSNYPDHHPQNSSNTLKFYDAPVMKLAKVSIDAPLTYDFADTVSIKADGNSQHTLPLQAAIYETYVNRQPMTGTYLDKGTGSNLLIKRKSQQVDFSLYGNKENVFVYLTSMSPAPNSTLIHNLQNIHLYEVGDSNEIPFDPVNRLYELGTISGGGYPITKNYYFLIDVDCSYLGGSLLIHHGSSCGPTASYPVIGIDGVTPASVCSQGIITIPYNLADANAIIQAYKVEEPATGCDNKTNTLEIKSIEQGDMYVNTVTTTLPKGMTYATGTTKLSMKNSDGSPSDIIAETPFDEPTIVVLADGRQQVMWDLSSKNTIDIAQFDFAKTNTVPRSLFIKYETAINCQYAGGTVNANVNQSTYCNVAANITMTPYQIPSGTLLCPASLGANAGNDMSVCKNNPVTLGTAAQAGLTYSWSPSVYLDDSTKATPVCTPTGAETTITYTLTVTNTATGCRQSDQVIVSVGALPVANAGSDVGVCKNSAVTIGTAAQTGFTYSWSPSTYLDDSTKATPVCTPTGIETAITYSLTVTNTTTGCSQTDAVIVSVNSLPAKPVINISGSTVICQGNAVTLSTTATGVSYQWQKDGTNISGATSSSYVASNAGSYSLIITGGTNCTTASDVVTVTVSSPPPANAGNDVSVCKNSLVALGTAAQTGLTYSWSPSVYLDDSTKATPVCIPTGTETTITYTLTVTNTATGCHQTDQVAVAVNPLPAKPVINTSGSTVVCQGNAVTLSTTATGVSYQWQKDGTNISGATSASYAASSAGSYSLIIAGGTNCTAASDPVVVAVNSLPSANAGNDVSVCKNRQVIIGTAAQTGLAYSWSPSVYLDDSTKAMPVCTPIGVETGIIYTLTVTNTATGCHQTDQVVVAVNPLPLANAGNDVSVCKNNSVIIGTAAQTGLVYRWSPSIYLDDSLKAMPVCTPTGTQTSITYTLTVTNRATGCSKIDQVIVTVNPSTVSDFTVTPSAITVCSGTSVTLDAGYCYNFNGTSNAVVTVPNSTSLGSSMSAITVAAWLRKSTGGNAYVVSKSGQYSLGIGTIGGTTGKAVFTINGTSSVAGTTNLNDNNWHYLVGTYQPGTNGLNIYVDGISQGSVTASGNIASGTTALLVGGQAPNGYINAKIDEVGIWNRVLTSQEINNFYHNCVPLTSTGLLAFWNIEGGSGTTMTDVSGNGNHGTMSSLVTWVHPGAPIGCYSWNPGNVSGNPITVSPTTTTTYTATLTNGSCSVSKSVTITVNNCKMADHTITTAELTKIIPNPSAYDFDLVVVSEENKSIEITVMNMNGEIIERAKANTNESFKFGPNYRSGIYLVKVNTGDKMEIHKVIKVE